MFNLRLLVKSLIESSRHCFLVGGAIIFIFLSALVVLSPAVAKRGNVVLNFFDVGQGDASLLKTPDGKFILIDGGPDNHILRRLGDYLPFYHRRIDYVILSHYHADHVVGLVEVIKRYNVKNFIYNPNQTDSPALRELLLEAQRRSIKIWPLADSATIFFNDDCHLGLLSPAHLPIKDDNNNSLVARFDCAGYRALLSGDNSAVVEKVLLEAGWDVSADIFKASHHGSKTANSAEFLRAVGPRLVIISVGTDNRFGHPSQEIIDRLQNLDIDFMRTDYSGTIQIFGGL